MYPPQGTRRETKLKKSYLRCAQTTKRTTSSYLPRHEGRERVVVAEHVLFGVALVARHRVVLVQDRHHPMRDDGLHRG